MTDRRKDLHHVPDVLLKLGGVADGSARKAAYETNVPEADIYGTGTFFHLLNDPDVKVRVCQGLSCQLQGSKAILDDMVANGLPAGPCQCLAACDKPVPVLRGRRVLPNVTTANIDAAQGNWEALSSDDAPQDLWEGHVGTSMTTTVFGLEDAHDTSGAATDLAIKMGADAVLDALEASGLQGRGGAGFPTHFKWRSVRGQAVTTRYVVLNADEGEPGTFKDRELLVRRPDLVVEGLLIAAIVTGARDVYCYLRGEFEIPWLHLETAIATMKPLLDLHDVTFHLHAGHGAYICGEETALLEALEGKRGMPRLKPPFPTEKGLWQKPTLIHNVETIAAVPFIVRHGGDAFKTLGRTGAGSKLYCISGHVENPGVYEMPLGVSLDELIDVAGGMIGNLKAFSPGGASSGFLPASERTRALDFKSLADVGSMLGSAGVVVLNDTVNMAWATQHQLDFFTEESCGQCAPCRIGTRFLSESLRHHTEKKKWQGREPLALVDDVAWEMNEGSICGLGQIASLPLTSARQFFPEDF